jgi:hypothetical protein
MYGKRSAAGHPAGWPTRSRRIRGCADVAGERLLGRSAACSRRAGPSQLGRTQRARGYFREHQIRRSGRTVQGCPVVPVCWPDVPEPSFCVSSWLWSWLQSWLQSRGCPQPEQLAPGDRLHCAGDGPRPVRAGFGLALGFWPEGVQAPTLKGGSRRCFLRSGSERIFGCP